MLNESGGLGMVLGVGEFLEYLADVLIVKGVSLFQCVMRVWRYRYRHPLPNGGIVINHRHTQQSKNIYINKCVCNIDVIFVQRRLHVSATLPSSGLYKIK
jgi:hypothetical protein